MGLIVTLTGGTSWALAVGMIIWLATVPVTLTGFVQTRRKLPEPRPTLWSMRVKLIRDSTHMRSGYPAA